MEAKRKGILLVNLGSPDSPSVADVRRYLREFLMDGRVIDVPWPLRAFIVGLFILPFRPKNSAEAYQAIWWKEGSPLIVLSQKLRQALEPLLEYPLQLAMRYGNPSIADALNQLHREHPKLDEIILVPLYPHYAMATVETVVAKVNDELEKQGRRTRVTTVEPFYNNALYIRELAESIKPYRDQCDHILFSYHGVPERHIRKTDPTAQHCLSTSDCCERSSDAHALCYRHQVKQTTKLVVQELGLHDGEYSESFQSRLGRDAWLTPFTEATIKKLAANGVKKLGVVCPAFISDCLETLEEIGIRGREDFIAAGGEDLVLIPCLNNRRGWVETLATLIEKTEIPTSAKSG